MAAFRSKATSAAVAILVVAGCASSAASPVVSTPSLLATPAPVAVPSGAPSASASSPGASVVASGSPAAATIPVRAGEAWVAYDWFQEGKDTRDLFLARPDGSDPHPIATDVPGDHREPGWSPDGSRIAFQNRVGDAQWEIWTANADGSGAARLFDASAKCPGGVNHPSWSPDGTKLALVCYPSDSDAQLAVLDMASRTLTPIVTATWPEFLDNNPRWSPDGKSIVFDILHWNPGNDALDGSLIAVVPATGGTVQRLTTFDTNMAHPDWRPDGSEIVMNSYDLGNIHATDQPSNLYLMTPDGTGIKQLTRSSTDGSMRFGEPRWTPDGKRVAVAIGTSSSPDNTIDFAKIAFVDASSGESKVFSESGGAHPDLRQTH